jgi:hypothetical protein
MGYLYLAAGAILFILGIVGVLKTGTFKASFYIYAILGLSLTVWGITTLRKARRNEIKDQTRTTVGRMASTRSLPTKKCPACGGDIEAALKRCPICDHQFPVIYTLTVFTPFDVAKREALIKYLMTRMNRPYEEISIQLERGMVFRYSSREDSIKNRVSFETLGCRVNEGEILSNT